jgi:hypothetical protein
MRGKINKLKSRLKEKRTNKPISKNKELNNVRLEKYSTSEFLRMTLNLSKLTVLSFWRKHRIVSRLIALLLVVIIIFGIFFDALNNKEQVDVYDIGGKISTLLDDPVDLYSSKLVYKEELKEFVFNEGYSPGGEVQGDSYTPKITATFASNPEPKVTVGDPVNNVSVSLLPQFSVKEPIQNSNRVLYPINGMPATKVYTLQSTGVKEDIVFRKAPNKDEITFKYEIGLQDGMEARLESDGSIGIYGVNSTLLGDVTTSTEEDKELLDSARENAVRSQFLFSIPAPIVIDGYKKTSSASARFELEGNLLTIRVVGMKNAKYPLSVDPTIYVETAQKLMRGNNETNIDFDVNNELIQKSQTTGARIDNWQTNLDMSEDVWGHSTAAAGGYVYRTGGRTGDGTVASPPLAENNLESLQNSNSTTFTMNMPGTRPAGDLYLAIMCHDGTGTVAAPGGGGWTEYADTSEFAAYYKVGTDAGGGDEAASYTWTGGSEKWGGIIVRVTNFNTSTPVSPTPTTNSGNSSTPTFPAITPANDDTLIIRAMGADNDEINDAGWAPTGHTAINQGGPTGTQDCAYAAASMDTPPSSGVSTGTTNMQSGYINDTYGSATIAINPAPGSGSPPTVVDTVEWAQFNPSNFAIESPNPGTGACTDWCNNSVYDLPEPRQNHSMVSYNGYLYVIGGEDASGTRESTVYISKLGANGEPQLWHPTDSNKNNWVYWYQDTGLNGGVARSYLSAVAYNNRIYILGGQTNASPGGVTTVEMADILPTGQLANWTTTGMQTLPAGAGTHMGDVVVYNDTLYVIGGFEGAETSTANMRNNVFYSKLNTNGTMNTWQNAEDFVTPRANFGGVFSYIWGAYIYMGGGCSAVNGSGYCTSYASDMQLASINADGSLGTWRSIGNLDNTRIGYTFIGWQGGLYRLGGCVSVDASSGECLDALVDVDYGVINPAGEVSTVKVSDVIGEGSCVGGSPSDCDLPDLGDGAGQGGGMLSSTVILNGYLYVIGGCTNFTCSTSSGNVSYSSIASNGNLQKPAVCSGTYAGSWCVDSTNRVNGTNGVSAAGITVFNNRIYVVGGIDESTTGVQAVTHNAINDDGSLDGAWEVDTFGSIGVTGEKSYTYAYARANPSTAGSNPGNLYIIGGCSSFSNSAGCSNSYNSEVYKCNIGTSGTVSGCTTTGQLQIDAELASETNEGLGLHSGTVYANYIYLVGGYSINVGDRATVFYAKFDDSNNIVDAESGTANPASDDDDWILSPNQLSIGRRRGFAFGYNGHIYAVGGFNAGGAGIIPFIEWAKEDVSNGSIDEFVTSSVTINQRWGLSMAVSNSYAYVVGGCDVGDSPGGCSSFEPSLQTFQLYNNDSGTPANYTAASNQFATDRYASSTVIHNGYIYLAGGCTDTVGDCSTTTADVQFAALDAEGDIGAWSSTTAGLPAGRGWGKLREAGGTLYWIGGQDSAGDEKSEVYYATPNTSTGNIASWSTASNGLPADRTQFGAASWNDRLYVVAGINDSAAVTNTVYISPDLSSGGNITSAWTTDTTNVPDVARSGNTVVAYANNLYSFGGYDGTNYLLDSQFTQINSDGSVDAWTFTTPLPNVTRQAEGFAANGYMYVVGGRSADNTCDSNTYVAPISANTTIATGNNPTGVGEWNETNVRYKGDRYGNSVAYNEGRLYLLGGICGASFPKTESLTETIFDTESTTHNVQMPSDVESGDLLLVFLSVDGGTGSTVTTPSGWTSINDTTNGTNVRSVVYAKSADGTEDGTTVNFATSNAEKASALTVSILASKWYGGSVATAVEATGASAGTTANPDSAALNPTNWGTENTLWFSYISGSTYSSVTTFPTNFVGMKHSTSGADTTNASSSLSYRQNNTASENPGAYTMGNSQSGIATTVAVRPAGSGSLTGTYRTVRTTLLSQPQLAKYSRLIDTDTDVFPNSWLLNGLDNSIGARWQVRYRTMHDLDTVVNPNEDCGTSSTMPQMTTWGQDTVFGDTTLGDVNPYFPLNSSGGNINCARYFYFFVEIDAEQTFGYPEDVNRGPTIADLSLFFTSDPSKRLRHGKTFTGGEQQPLDTPCRQSEDADCPLP